MRTEIQVESSNADVHADVEIVLSRDNIARLLEDGSFQSGMVRVNGVLTLPFAQGRVRVVLEEDEIHYAHPDREEAKQKIRDARKGI